MNVNFLLKWLKELYNLYLNREELIIDHLNSSFFFQAFSQLLQAPHDDADGIIKERFPVPRLVVCDQHGSQVNNLSLF